jgi:trehalose-6-phosphatase
MTPRTHCEEDAMFLMGELKISGKGEPRLNEKGEAGKRTMYSFPEAHEFELVLSDGNKDDCRFNFYVALDESEKVSIGTEDVESSISNGFIVVLIKDEKGDVISLTLSPEQVQVLYRILENAHVAFESLGRLQKTVIVNEVA